jgi:hypothetical protein
MTASGRFDIDEHQKLPQLSCRDLVRLRMLRAGAVVDSSDKSERDTVKYWQWQFGRPPCPQVMSRRRDLRIETPKSLTLAIAGSLVRVSVKDISLRGLCLSAGVPFALGSIHPLTLTLGRMTVNRRGRTIHCHRHPTEGWIVGIEFLDDPARPGDSAVDDLVQEVAAGDVAFK